MKTASHPWVPAWSRFPLLVAGICASLLVPNSARADYCLTPSICTNAVGTEFAFATYTTYPSGPDRTGYAVKNATQNPVIVHVDMVCVVGTSESVSFSLGGYWSRSQHLDELFPGNQCYGQTYIRVVSPLNGSPQDAFFFYSSSSDSGSTYDVWDLADNHWNYP